MGPYDRSDSILKMNPRAWRGPDGSDEAELSRSDLSGDRDGDTNQRRCSRVSVARDGVGLRRGAPCADFVEMIINVSVRSKVDITTSSCV